MDGSPRSTTRRWPPALSWNRALRGAGISEFPSVTAAELLVVMRAVRALDGLLLVHAEHPYEAPATPAYHDYLDAADSGTEDAAVAMVAEAAGRTGCRTHIVHVS